MYITRYRVKSTVGPDLGIYRMDNLDIQDKLMSSTQVAKQKLSNNLIHWTPFDMLASIMNIYGKNELTTVSMFG